MATVAPPMPAGTRSRALPSGTPAGARRPPFADGLVPRPRLVERLADSGGPSLAVIAAPAGYGKTSLLADWARSERRRFAWVALGECDDDPATLRAAVARSLAGTDPDQPFALALDDVHVLRSAGARQALRELVESIPPGSRLALASRTQPDLPTGRLRAHRALIEIRSRDLALTLEEAATLFRGEGVALSPPDVRALLERTEGWPAGLYLAAVSLLDQRDRVAAVDGFHGDDAAVADYLRDVVLSELEPEQVRFLMHASVLERLAGPVCDLVLEESGSGGMLERIARSNLLLTPLDRSGTWYRCHTLLAEMLRGELRRREPDAEAGLHRRAADWYADHADPEHAVRHAIASGASERAGELVWSNMPEFVAKGRNETVRAWLDGFSAEQVAADPLLALTAGHSCLADGELDAVQRWESSARRGLEQCPSGDRRSVLEAGVAILSAAGARDGLAQMGRDASRAFELEPEDSHWRAICCLLDGVARHLTGDRTGAEPRLEDGARRGAVAAPHIQALCLTQLALMSGERDDWESAAALCARARAQVDHYALGGYPTSALVFAASALIHARKGRVEAARRDGHEAERLLAALGGFTPWYDVEARLALARAMLKLGDVPSVRRLLAEAAPPLRRIPEAAALHAWTADLERQVDSVSTQALAGPASLTTAELRILRFLPTHLSFREIAATIYVSANTVKTQAHAVYRKLDASSRSQAVTRATELGLLDL